MKIAFNKIGQFTISNKPVKDCREFGFANTVVREGATFDAQMKNLGIIATTDALTFVSKEETGDGFTVNYKIEEKDLDVKIISKTFDGIDVIEQKTAVKNNGGTRYLTQIASSNVNEVCFDDKNFCNRLSDGSIVIHLCQSKWEGEGQWISFTPDQLGLYPRAFHPWEYAHFRLDSVSSWSTGEHYPLIIIEDKKKNEVWYFEINGGVSWFFDIYMCGGFNAKSLSVKFGGADERLGCVVKLDKNQSFTTISSCYGVTKGSFEDAVGQLLRYKRKISVKDEKLPVIFNDYMDCNWADESDETLIPLIDKASEIGCKIFCIDDGWQKSLGLWYPAEEKFKKGGLQGIINYIRQKNMLPGVWFEFESVTYQLKDILHDDSIFLTRNGAIVEPHRPLGNFRSEALVKYLRERVDAVYKMGVRYIKNDHNNTEFVGAEYGDENVGVCLKNNNDAFLAFIDGLKKDYPDLIIENCGSGAMRSDNGTLSHFHIQSVSDQEYYLKNPSIVSGSVALYPPEKAGIWAYPYPLYFERRENLTLSEEGLNLMKDGEQTAFNLVTALLGKPYLSGKIFQADELNTELLKSAVNLSENLADFICASTPVYPMGTLRMCESKIYSMGLIGYDKKKMLLAVWNLKNTAETLKTDLKKYAMSKATLIYPENLPANFNFKNDIFTCSLKAKTARLFMLEK